MRKRGIPTLLRRRGIRSLMRRKGIPTLMRRRGIRSLMRRKGIRTLSLSLSLSQKRDPYPLAYVNACTSSCTVVKNAARLILKWLDSFFRESIHRHCIQFRAKLFNCSQVIVLWLTDSHSCCSSHLKETLLQYSAEKSSGLNEKTRHCSRHRVWRSQPTTGTESEVS